MEGDSGEHLCNLVNPSDVGTTESSGQNGYCVYICYEENSFDDNNYVGDYYFYKIRTNMMLNVPIVNDILDIPVYSNTNRLYNFNK